VKAWTGWRPGRLTRRWLTAAALAMCAFVSVMVAQRHVGVARDEVTYISHGTRYAHWWIDLVTFRDATVSEKRITDTFGGPRATDGNREHPPLVKTLFGLSRILFHDELGWTSEVTASRLPTALLNALAVALVFWFGAMAWAESVGLIAALLLLMMPRLFFHAGLATFDAPMVALWLATLCAYYRSLESRRWSLALAACFGLALATKHNALMLPGVIAPHYAWVCWRRAREAAGGAGARLRAFARALLRTQPFLVPALAVGGPLVLVAVWPWLWFDTVQHVRDWIGFHTAHVNYNFEYLGTNYNHPPFPWHVVLVTTLFTVPVVTMAAAVMGAVDLGLRVWRGTATHPDRAPALLLLLSATVSMGVFLLPSTPIFGAEKHWAPAMPTLCLLAGIGVVAAAERSFRLLLAWRWIPPASATFARRGVIAALAVLVMTAALTETEASHPYALSYWNALAGGAAGGADLGMNRQFWGVSARGALPFVDRFAPAAGKPDVPVYSHDASPAWGLYRKLGLLSPRLPDAGNEEAGVRRSKIALVIHEKHFLRHDLMVWTEYGTIRPAHVVTFGGVPLVSVYVRPALRPTSRPTSLPGVSAGVPHP
jgi:hypothetical protein